MKESTAYLEGKLAARNGKTGLSCPYFKSIKKSQDWMRGHFDGLMENHLTYKRKITKNKA